MTEHCRWLRWKGHDRGAPEGAPQAHHGSTYSCLRTGHPWGPDDRPASHDACDTRRVCFSAPASERASEQ